RGVDPPDARDDGLLVDIQPGAAGMQHVHRQVSPKCPSHGATSRGGATLLDVLRRRRERRRWATGSGTRDGFARLTRGLEAPRNYRRKAVRGAKPMISWTYPIFMGSGAARMA